MEKFLEVQLINKDYVIDRKKKRVLKDISLDLMEGEIVCLLGVNGAGKTTLSSILTTLIPPTSGRVLWKGKSVYDQLFAYRKIIGFSPQKPNLDPLLTLEENLIFAGRYYGMEKALAERKAEGIAERFQLKEYMKEKTEVLSGGYKQRFLLARTLMHDPKILVLDEPTVGLDPQIRKSIWSLIRELKKENKTILFTTHYLEEAENIADRVCVLSEGVIKTMDTPDQLKHQWKKANLEDVFLLLISEEKKELL
jgi:ABC-2 type transport system ATP-binding protein